MIEMAMVSLAGMGVLAILTRAPLWRTIDISIAQGLEAGGREPGQMS
jgi:hypothetical protein